MSNSKCTKLASTSYHLQHMGDELKLFEPCKELFNYYICRISEIMENHDTMLKQINKLKKSSEADLMLQREVFVCNEEVFDLRRALSDMQLCLQKEREQILSLNAENDVLRVHLLQYHKKVDNMCKILKYKDGVEVQLFLNRDENRICPEPVQKKRFSAHPSHCKNFRKNSSAASSCENKTADNKSEENTQVLDSNEEAALLMHHDKVKIALLNDEIMTLTQDRYLKHKEWGVEVKHLQKQISKLSSRLHETERKLIEAHEQVDKISEELVSKDVLLTKEKKKMTEYLEELRRSQKPPLDQMVTGTAKTKSKLNELSMITEQLTLRDNLLNVYYDQCKSLKEQLKQESNALEKLQTSHKEKVDNVLKHVAFLERKLKEENQRRAYDVQGILSSMKLLLYRIQLIEKKIFKEKLCKRQIKDSQ